MQGTAVLNAVPAGHTRPQKAKLCALIAFSYVLSLAPRMALPTIATSGSILNLTNMVPTVVPDVAEYGQLKILDGQHARPDPLPCCQVHSDRVHASLQYGAGPRPAISQSRFRIPLRAAKTAVVSTQPARIAAHASQRPAP
jgi:hypothetical protein